MYKFSLPFNNAVFFLNKSDIEEFRNKKLVSINQTQFLDGIGLDLKYFSFNNPITENKNVNFLFMGRLLREKGVYEFIKLVPKNIKKIDKNVTFTIVGNTDKNPGSIPLKEIQKWEKEGIIHWVKFAEDVRPYLYQSSVFVLPSYREGSRSIQEAMAIGRAIITCDSIGHRETVENGVNGFLVKIQDSLDLTEKMEIF